MLNIKCKAKPADHTHTHIQRIIFVASKKRHHWKRRISTSFRTSLFNSLIQLDKACSSIALVQTNESLCLPLLLFILCAIVAAAFVVFGKVARLSLKCFCRINYLLFKMFCVLFFHRFFVCLRRFVFSGAKCTCGFMLFVEHEPLN